MPCRRARGTHQLLAQASPGEAMCALPVPWCGQPGRHFCLHPLFLSCDPGHTHACDRGADATS